MRSLESCMERVKVDDKLDWGYVRMNKGLPNGLFTDHTVCMSFQMIGCNLTFLTGLTELAFAVKLVFKRSFLGTFSGTGHGGVGDKG